MSETTYQNLKLFLPPTKEDTRSVHFLMFPEVKKEYFNADIERTVGRMQSVIELGRYIRDQKTISLKTPCREMIIINPDPVYHSDIKSLETYIKEEMNVRTVTVTSDEEKYGVNYKLLSDARELGVKYKKDASKIRAALQKVPKSEIKEFVEKGEIEVLGFKLTNQDMKVVRTFDNENSNMNAHFTNDVLVILDTELDSGLVQEGIAREFINRVQRLRKKAELQPTDDIKYYVKITTDDGTLDKMFTDQKELLVKYLKQDVEFGTHGNFGVILEEEQEINEGKLMLALVK
jgi:isoleucyl-tRNA synthetase